MIYEENGENSDQPAQPPVRPWIVLTTSYDVEAWIDHYNRDLRQAIQKPNTVGHGICFYLAHGGEIYMHTTVDGDVLLDVTPEAEWVAPVITAATGVNPPVARIWALPADTMTQLVLGLSSLIVSTKIVLQHDFKIKRYS